MNALTASRPSCLPACTSPAAARRRRRRRGRLRAPHHERRESHHEGGDELMVEEALVSHLKRSRAGAKVDKGHS